MEREGADEIDRWLRPLDPSPRPEGRFDVEGRRGVVGDVEDVGAEHVVGRLFPGRGIGLPRQAECLAGVGGVGEEGGHVEDELPGILGRVEHHPPRREAADDGVIVAEGPAQEMLVSDNPFVHQFVHGEPDGPVAFQAPSRPYRSELGLGGEGGLPQSAVVA